MSDTDTKEQKRLRQEQTTQVLHAVANGENVFEAVNTYNLSEHTTVVVREGVRSGDMTVNTHIAHAIANLPLSARVAHTTDCFEHALHTKQSVDVCTFWRDAVLVLAPKVKEVEVRQSLVNGLKVCAAMGNTVVGNALLATLIAQTKGMPQIDNVLKAYFKFALEDTQSIENVCRVLPTVLDTPTYDQGMVHFLTELHSIIDQKTSKMGRKPFNCLINHVLPKYQPIVADIVWQRCLKWCSMSNYGYGKASIDYMLYYASQNGTTACWEALTTCIKNNCLNGIGRGFNYHAVETSLDLLQRLMSSSALMDQHAHVVRAGLRDVLATVGSHNFTYSRDKEVVVRIQDIYAAFEKSELLQHVGHTHASVVEKNKRKM